MSITRDDSSYPILSFAPLPAAHFVLLVQADVQIELVQHSLRASSRAACVRVPEGVLESMALAVRTLDGIATREGSGKRRAAEPDSPWFGANQISPSELADDLVAALGGYLVTGQSRREVAVWLPARPEAGWSAALAGVGFLMHALPRAQLVTVGRAGAKVTGELADCLGAFPERSRLWSIATGEESDRTAKAEDIDTLLAFWMKGSIS